MTGKIQIPLSDESWIHRLIGFTRRLKKLRDIMSKSTIRYYGNKMVIEDTVENIKEITDLIFTSMEGIEIKETDIDKVFKK